MEFVVDGSADFLAEYLASEGIHEDVVTKIVDNRITCSLFLDLREEDLKDLATVIGDRIALRKILEKARKCKEQPASQQGSVATVVQPVRPQTLQANSASSSDWHNTFAIPDLNRFSPHIQSAINNGIITGRAKREIYQVLRTYITAFTLYPTPEQYTTICRNLIEKYPILGDTDGPSKYTTWKMGLRNSFKNIRRGLKNNQLADDDEPPPKRRRVYYGDNDEENVTQEEHDRAVKKLKDAFNSQGKKKGNQFSKVKRWMDITRQRRNQWIQEDPSPTLSEIFNEFPHLRTIRWLRREFKVLASLDDVSAVIENWIDWGQKIMKFAEIESTTRPVIKKLIRSLPECEDLFNPDDAKDMICMEILLKLIYPRGPKKGFLLYCTESTETDIDQEISELDQSEPFILVTGKPGTETSQFFICCESEIILESKSLRNAIVDLMSSYYVFDISYPKSISGILIFLQHHVFCLADEQAVPPAVKTLLANLQKL